MGHADRDKYSLPETVAVITSMMAMAQFKEIKGFT
jgi:hypothetical protein